MLTLPSLELVLRPGCHNYSDGPWFATVPSNAMCLRWVVDGFLLVQFSVGSCDFYDYYGSDRRYRSPRCPFSTQST